MALHPGTLLCSPHRSYTVFQWDDETKVWRGLFDKNALPAIVDIALEEYFELEKNNFSGKDFAKFLEYVEQQGNSSRLEATAKYFPSYHATHAPRNFDSEPKVLNTKNGALDLTTGHLDSECHKDYLCIMQTGVEYQGQAKAPIWEELITHAFPDANERAFVQRMLGLAVTDSSHLHKFFVHEGSGGNGKSLVFDVITKVLGTYAADGDDALFQKRSAERKFGTIHWEGKRVLRVEEFGGSVDQNFLKAVTGGGQISAEVKYGGRWTFNAQFVAHFLTNRLPEFSNEESMERRMIIVPWRNKLPKQMVSELIDRLRNKADHLAEVDRLSDLFLAVEGSGILNWLIRGYRAVYNAGTSDYEKALNVPKSFAEEAKDHLVLSDSIASFLYECTESVMEGTVEFSQAALYKNFENFLIENGWDERRKPTRQSFNKTLETRYGHTRITKRKNTYWTTLQMAS